MYVRTFENARGKLSIYALTLPCVRGKSKPGVESEDVFIVRPICMRMSCWCALMTVLSMRCWVCSWLCRCCTRVNSCTEDCVGGYQLMTRVGVDARVDGVCVPLLSYARTASVSVYMSSLHRYSDGLIGVALTFDH